MQNKKITVAMDESLLLVADLLALALDLTRNDVFTLVLKWYIDHDPDCRRVIMSIFDEADGDESLSEEAMQVLEGHYWEYIRQQMTEAR